VGKTVTAINGDHPSRALTKVILRDDLCFHVVFPQKNDI